MIRRNRAWTLILLLGALVRASSYTLRPPGPGTATKIEQAIGYSFWATLLTATAVMLAAGLVLHRPFWLFVGHGLGVTCFLTFALSTGWTAVTDSRPWQAIAPLLLCALLHGQRMRETGEQAVGAGDHRGSDAGRR